MHHPVARTRDRTAPLANAGLRLRQIAGSAVQKFNGGLRWVLVDLLRSRAFVDFYLHRYASYEEDRRVQIYHNLRKLKHVWADA